VPSDYRRVYAALQALEAADLAPGRWFCEWGSGLGVVACLAALLGFESCGIEVEGELVDAARQLADDFDLPVVFAQGSFIPDTEDLRAGIDEDFAWLSTTERCGYGELGLGPDDFDVVFAYPWPDEEQLTRSLFECHAREGALLMTYHGGDQFRLRRKTAREGGR